MIIANPIYDVVFKRLMENEKVAKFFIGTLLEQTIETVEVKPQEFTYNDNIIGISLFRLDFIATIKTETGELKKILIEVQKAKNITDIIRFRSYLGEQYKKEDVINEVKTVLPITTIYILGFKLPEIETPCLKIERNYKDLINKKILKKRSDFVEKLTHDSFIVQVDRITGSYQTKLEKLLSVFEQTNFVDDTKVVKEFTHIADLEGIKLITDILHYSGTNPEEKKKIEVEQEAWRSIDELFDSQRNELLKELAERQEKIYQKDKEIETLKKLLNQKNKK